MSTTHGRFDSDDAQRLLALMNSMRAESALALRQWIQSADNRSGGRLLLVAPTKPNGPGHLPEAAFMSERWIQLSQG